MTEVQTAWLDTVGGAYPVFDAKRGTGGRDHRTDVPAGGPRGARPTAGRCPRTARSSARRGTCIPGGLWTDLKLTRDGRTTRALPLAREVLRAGGRGLLGRLHDRDAAGLAGRRCARATCSASRAPTTPARRRGTSRWRSCRRCSTRAGRAPDPFAVDVDVEGKVTHGHLPENDGHGGSRLTGLPDPRDLLARPVGGNGKVAIAGFVYGQGDLSNVGRDGPPRAGRAAAAGSRSSTATPSRRSSTRSPRARRPATARRASRTRWRTPRSTSTRASSASARRASRPPRTATRGRRRRGSTRASTRTSAACTRSCAGRSRSRGSGASDRAHPGATEGAGVAPQPGAAIASATSRGWVTSASWPAARVSTRHPPASARRRDSSSTASPGAVHAT